MTAYLPVQMLASALRRLLNSVKAATTFIVGPSTDDRAALSTQKEFSVTLQEREMLQAFLQQLAQAQAQVKDAEADSLIHEAVTRQPDASYLLVQRTMGLELAVQAAQAQITRLQAELEQLRTSAEPSSFLSGANAWGRHPGTVAAPLTANAIPPLRPAPAPVIAPAPAYAPAPASSWGSGILGSVATTAAGVVAGSLLYQGIQNLMGHHASGAAAAFDPVMPLASNDMDSPSAVLQSFRSDSPVDPAAVTAGAVYSDTSSAQDYDLSVDDGDLSAGDDSYPSDSGDYA